MATLNFPDPAVTQTYEAAGITWTWNATLGVWSAEAGTGFDETVADARYLRVDAAAGDQERVSGEATFAEQTTHAGGLEISGGDAADITTAGFVGIPSATQFVSAGEPVISITSSGRMAYGTPFSTANANVRNNLAILSNSNTGYGFYAGCEVDSGVTVMGAQYGAVVRSADTGNYAHLTGYNAATDPADLKGNVDLLTGFSITAGSGTITDNANKTACFYTDTGEGSGTNYGYYAPSGVPSYSKGSLGLGIDEAAFSPTSFVLHTDGGVRMKGINSTGSTTELFIASSGTLTTSSSDERLKTNINPLPACAEKVKQLNPISFNWIDTEEYGERLHLGFTAQDVEEVVPEAVGASADGMKSLSNSTLIPVLTKALQEALERIEVLEASSAASLEERVAQLEAADAIDNAGDAGAMALVAELLARVSALEATDQTAG